MRNYVELMKLAYKAIDEAGVDIDPPLLLAEMAGLKENRQNCETYKASQMTDAECVAEMVEVAKSCKDGSKVNKENLLNALDWIITFGFDFWDQFTNEEWAIANKAVEIIDNAFFDCQERMTNEEAIDEALKSWDK